MIDGFYSHVFLNAREQTIKSRSYFYVDDVYYLVQVNVTQNW